MRNYYKPGCWNADCDVCGFLFKSDELKLRWDGLMVCSKDFETRHPQDLLRVPKDDPHVPWTRQNTDVFLTSNLTTQTPEPLTTEAGDNLIW